MSANVFGTATTVFNFQTMNSLIQSGLYDNFQSAKTYFSTYHAKSYYKDFYVFEPDGKEGNISLINDRQMDSIFSKIETEVIVTIGNKTMKEKFDLKKWFLKHNPTNLTLDQDPYNERFFQDPVTQRQYLNISKGFKHKVIKPYDSYADEIKEKVQFILRHIRDVWNSGNEEQYFYVLLWLSYALTSRKVETALYLKSGEGTGKSIVIEFFIEHVIGQELGLSTSNMGQLLRFNSQLIGKTLLVGEELASASKSEWTSLSDIIKDLITGKMIDFEAKYSNITHLKNIISLIMITNNENTLKFGKDARRYFFADISHDRVGDIAYFDELADYCNDPLVGECFYMYLREHCAKYPDFNEARMPMTAQKIAVKARNITPLLQYFKDMYVCRGKDVELTLLSNEYSSFKEYCELNALQWQKDHSTIQGFHTHIKEIAIFNTKSMKSNGLKSNVLHIQHVSHECMLKYYKSKHLWNDDYDVFYEDSDDNDDNSTSQTDLNTTVQRLNAQLEQLKKENELLKKENEDLKKAKKAKAKVAPKPDTTTKKIICDLECHIDDFDIAADVRKHLVEDL